MKNPVSTYRVQLSPDFTFNDLKKILDYLENFGVSTVYSAPFFQARKGSTHGYDITNPFTLNEEIGTLEEFREISRCLHEKSMNWLQDIVPNHMAFDGANLWLQDIFELGPYSRHFNFFDVDWKKEGDKLMAPFLGEPLEQVLQKGDLKIRLLEDKIVVKYFDHEYPASSRSYAEIVSDEEFKKEFREFSGSEIEWKQFKKAFFERLENEDSAKKEIENNLEKINSSEEKRKQFLDLQYFLPEHWKKTEEHINYRRFFTINDLICLSMEDREVFEEYHKFILELCDQDMINGLRIDHIDGLFDPLGYLENLRSVLGNDFYIIIEKILEWDEKLPSHWPVQGTSGYGFLAEVNQVLTNHDSEERFTQEYHKINPRNNEYAELVYKQKLFILKERMGGEYANLWQLIRDLELIDREMDSSEFKEALGAFLAAFPVYRIYPEEYPLKKRQKKIIDIAYQNALDHFPKLENQLNKLREIFMGEAQKDRENMLFFLQRCQQFTGPLAAKGVEDTSFYIFNKLISHNEVGDSPENFGLSVSGFHEKMLRRQEDFPLSINATATHDTKRGEDARMRINVLSELEDEWFRKAEEWKQIAAKNRNNENVPDANEEYFIFQMLVGHWPFEDKPGEEFFKRSTAYLQKVLREAKEHSSWADPDEEYENEIYDYLEMLLRNDDFLKSFLPFQKKITRFGVVKSLSQSVLKITAPGVPDVYQGTELWDLSYVDPDNRRPVDYALRKKYLEEIDAIAPEGLQQELQGLKQNYSSGKIKMYCLHRALITRGETPGTFEEGEYLPLQVEGEMADKILAFARKDGGNAIVVAVPASATELFDEEFRVRDLPRDLKVILPEKLDGTFKNVFSGGEFSTKELVVKELFKDFPVALLKLNQ